ncbi:MAG: hypothetical protein E6G96_19285 [Alphaproteobacteria bacterium]|jgi:hypothetical protein|nr:MAG: hypothetical protein E6G96_19285 [Alphaproteobacteria bacterium]
MYTWTRILTRRSGSIPGGSGDRNAADHLVEGALTPDLQRLLYRPFLDDEEAPVLRIRASAPL